jgi:hypothetical protein
VVRGLRLAVATGASPEALEIVVVHAAAAAPCARGAHRC